ncbi:hypothetical protein Barb6XT_02752 [Bacteroidales bacterium Barb6XT]|nr:hypothetical protein Barb6XT_02752 [Bacteroidales bacterium Barb6XT]
MKKIILFLFSMVLFASCNNDTDDALSVIDEQAGVKPQLITGTTYTHVDVKLWHKNPGKFIVLKGVDKAVYKGFWDIKFPPPILPCEELYLTISDYDKRSAAKGGITSLGFSYSQTGQTLKITVYDFSLGVEFSNWSSKN